MSKIIFVLAEMTDISENVLFQENCSYLNLKERDIFDGCKERNNCAKTVKIIGTFH